MRVCFKTLWMAALMGSAFAFTPLAAQACQGVESEDVLFHQTKDETAQFVADVEILSVGHFEQHREVLAKLKRLYWPDVQEGFGDEIVLLYDESSCGPAVEIGDTGLIVGEMIPNDQSTYEDQTIPAVKPRFAKRWDFNLRQ